jgi:hypothetical protein
VRTKLNEIREALTRKAGPLPVWAWALIAGAAIYVYRTRKSLAGGATIDGGGTGSGGATSPGVSDSTGGGDASSSPPVPLAPGESIYDPTTHQLLGGSPAQQDPGGGNDMTPMDPITIDPGQQVYDPNTHQLVGKGTNNKGGKGKRKPKPKGGVRHGRQDKGKKTKGRSKSAIRNPLHRKKANAAPKARTRSGATKPSAPAKGRVRAIPKRKPVVVQHHTAAAPTHQTVGAARPIARPASKPRKRK